MPPRCLWRHRKATSTQAKTDDGTTPLFMAAQSGHVDVVGVLVDAGANVYQARTDDGTTPLFMAAQNGHVDVVGVLVDAAANVNQAKTDSGATPLHIASHNNHLHVIQELINARVDIHATDLAGLTPLAVAQRRNRKEAVAALRAAGATH